MSEDNIVHGDFHGEGFRFTKRLQVGNTVFLFFVDENDELVVVAADAISSIDGFDKDATVYFRMKDGRTYTGCGLVSEVILALANAAQIC